MKMKQLIALCSSLAFLIVVAVSCSHVNQESKRRNESLRGIRHGVVPISNSGTNYQTTYKDLDMKSVARGKVIYKQHCFACHGINGEGDGPAAKDMIAKPRNLSKVVKEVPNFEFYIKISEWVGKMPGWKTLLTHKEVMDVKSYIIHIAQEPKN